MPIGTFAYLLDLLPNAYRVVLVGLGEPTLHPLIDEVVSLAVKRGHRVNLVTNAMTLDKDLAGRLLSAGISAMTFSLDSVDEDPVAHVRPGSDLNRILGNIRRFAALAKGKVATAIFSAVSTHTVDHLPRLSETVSDLGVDAWMLSDLNFLWNLNHTMAQNWSPKKQTAMKRAMSIAFGKGLPVFSVRALEEIGLSCRFREFLMTAPSGIIQRSEFHRWCLSPWQTVPVDVNGNVTVCDCQPEAHVGNLLSDAFSDIWNGKLMQTHRRRMVGQFPPAACRRCPRF